MRDLPMPASPESNATRPRACSASCHKVRSQAVYSSRLTSGSMREGCAASKRLAIDRGATTLHTRTGSLKPFNRCVPRSAQSKRSPMSARVDGAIMTAFGDASACSRAASWGFRQGLPPLRTPLADEITDYDDARGDADPDRERFDTSTHRQGRDCRNNAESRAHRSFRIVLVGARVTEKREDAIARVARNGAVVALDDRRARGLVSQYEIAKLFGVQPRVEGARADQITEEDSELSAFGLRPLVSEVSARSGFERFSAVTAKTKLERVCETAGGAHGLLRGSGLRFALLVLRVLCFARGSARRPVVQRSVIRHGSRHG